MESPDELLSWTEAEIEREIVRNIEPSSQFVCDWQEGAWSARVENAGAPSYAFIHVDRRMALYSVYGALWMRGHASPTGGSDWDASAPRPTIASVTRYVQSTLQDPEDVDPEEVAAVYGLPPTPKG